MNLDYSVIKESKNLLAFSAGIDSCALFFSLCEQNIPFDIVIVDYNIREQSKEEINYAKQLAKKYNKQIFIKEVKLDTSNFEKKARDVRYSFFKELIDKHQYSTLITAHQLNDKLEWFMMQLSKGSGLVELIGFNKWEEKENYKVFKPLLDISKKELESYLKEKGHKYFIDESNYDEKYKRNYFRHNFSDKFIDKFEDGVKKSFKYLDSDINSLDIQTKAFYEVKKLEIFKNSNDNNMNIRTIDLSLKRRGYLLSKASRDEIIRQEKIVVSHKISITIDKNYIWISPYSKVLMDKKFKEVCRIKKIPQNIRAYLFENNIDIKSLMI